MGIGLADNRALLIVTVRRLAGAGLVATRFRWMPLLIVLLSGIFLYQIATEPFVTYHLTNPKAGGFFPFVLDILIIAFLVVTLGASIGAALQNYPQPNRKTPPSLPS